MSNSHASFPSRVKEYLDENTFLRRIKAHAATELEKEYPWMAKADVKEISEHTAATLRKGIIAQKPKMQAAKSRMDFFSLSAELRNQIYDLALKDHSDDGNGTVFISRLSEGTYRDGSIYCTPGAFSTTPALLRSSKQIRSETESIYYNGSTFIVEAYMYCTRFTWRWLKQLEPHLRSKIRDLVLQLPDNREELNSRIRTKAKMQKKQKAQRISGDPPDRTVEVRLPRKLWTTVKWTKNLVGFKTYDIAATALTIKYSRGSGTLSSTELFCAFCYHFGEPDTGRFSDGICVKCPKSHEENGMQAGPWCEP